MREIPRPFLRGLAMCALSAAAAHAAEHLRLHPDNPHYLLFRGKPAVLITSTEHSGAVLNLDFDHGPYLAELQARGLNLTRTFSGVYCEGVGNFGIKNNTLAPRAGGKLPPGRRCGTTGCLPVGTGGVRPRRTCPQTRR